MEDEKEWVRSRVLKPLNFRRAAAVVLVLVARFGGAGRALSRLLRLLPLLYVAVEFLL